MFRGNDTFDFRGVLPGSYDVTASCQTGNRSRSTRIPVEVTDHNVEGLVVTFKAETGVTIEGTVRAAAPQPATFHSAGIHVSLRSLDNAESGAVAATLRDGSFTLQNVVPGKYEVGIYSPPEDGYLKSVKYLDREPTDQVIEVPSGAGGAKLEVVIAFDVGEASGAVEDAAGAFVPGAVVFLYPKSAAKCACQQMASTTSTAAITYAALRRETTC